MTWKRLRESEIKASGSMLPARLVLEYDETQGAWRTYLETLKGNGEAGFQYGRFFEAEADAIDDFEQRARRL